MNKLQIFTFAVVGYVVCLLIFTYFNNAEIHREMRKRSKDLVKLLAGDDSLHNSTAKHGDFNKNKIQKYMSTKRSKDLEYSDNERITLNNNFDREMKDDATQENNNDLIPESIYKVIDELINKDDFKLPDCNGSEERVNFVYNKVHKCASDTISAIGRHIALERDLSVVLPIGRRFLIGWPHQLAPYMYRQSLNSGFNICVDHAIYNRTYFDQIMPADTVYFASLREPLNRLISAVDYFGVAPCSFMHEDIKDAMEKTDEFLNNMTWYDSVYKSVENIFNLRKCGCVPKGISMVKNAMAFDLGFPTGFHMGTVDESKNYVFIAKWLRTIFKELQIVIITDRFDASMLLIKRFMCWRTKDILYKRLNDWHHDPPDFSTEKSQAYRNWSNVDTLLYTLFSRALDKRIKNQGDDFQMELKEYSQHLIETRDFCQYHTRRGRKKWRKSKNWNPGKVLQLKETQWDSAYEITVADCKLLYDKHHMRNIIKERYDDMLLGKTLVGYPNPGYRWC